MMLARLRSPASMSHWRYVLGLPNALHTCRPKNYVTLMTRVVPEDFSVDGYWPEMTLTELYVNGKLVVDDRGCVTTRRIIRLADSLAEALNTHVVKGKFK